MEAWDPLPQRHKRTRAPHARSDGSEESAPAAPAPAPALPPACAMTHATPLGAVSAAIERNVAARAREALSRAAPSLQARDGHAGEFYEYLDHTADVQCHAWGADMKAAFEHVIPCMFNYMTDLSQVGVCEADTVSFTVHGKCKRKRASHHIHTATSPYFLHPSVNADC
jgi:hypothetical protein